MREYIVLPIARHLGALIFSINDLYGYLMVPQKPFEELGAETLADITVLGN